MTEREPPLNDEIAQLARELAITPPIDEAKVARVKAAIASGQYRIDPDAIADALIRWSGQTAPSAP
ncbi:flagellar biosynthesis anti-sigma factor FlgM [Sandaracinobacteroides saxicola]|uniref:Negative regulator of flagellin synthesis n=1 Tax=Sandaracinobacteroides saxicola TaxID=2759707 RepID=A0A7G5ILX2_9SPHN|nr:flagellar biosynthesis anti-sigma factor FlgM [Sandaracinobacteroides saxicola]QMW24364.1 flagellar biosynthesis anti-sigma factor FlgM [Sandaracinobacteroides saxicola]